MSSSELQDQKSSSTKAEPEPKAEPGHTPMPPTEPELATYAWTSILREWVSAPAIVLGATPEQEAAYLEHWRQLYLADEHADTERQMQADREQQEEERACRIALPPPEQTPEESAQAAWETAFPWAGPPPAFIDLTGDDDNKGDA